MDSSEALRALSSTSSAERLAAARQLADEPTVTAYPALREAQSRENDRWVRQALSEALQSIEAQLTEPSNDRVDVDNDAMARAVQQVAKEIIHEIEPIVGLLRLYMEAAQPNIPEARAELHRLEILLEGIERLSNAAAVPKAEVFNLSGLIARATDHFHSSWQVPLKEQGPDSLVCSGDESLVTLALSNGLKNAAEAVVSAPANGTTRQVVVTWGETDIDYWIAVLDDGMGPPMPLNRLFDFGQTSKSKREHLGVGLTIARRAMLGLGGQVNLRPRLEGGAAFEMRWPKSHDEAPNS